MSLSLLFNLKETVTPTIGDLELDATITEEHTLTAVATEYPIEDGSTITDHIYTQPEKLSMEGFVTNSPIAFLGIDAGEDRAASAYETLKELYRNRETVRVVTALQVYEDMAITRLSFPRNVGIGQALRFTAELQKIRKATFRTVAIPADDVSDPDTLASETDIGKQSGAAASAATESKASTLMEIFKSFGFGG